ncbi:MAG TPA: ATP-binding protein [Bacillota bacterium]|nr:ATP-binding protein [Bacillota bacterium]HPT87662.1 ATP-binding protein [Bacillota bacterium]
MEKRITVIGGAYGSGKTEFSMAYALEQAKKGYQVGLIDLDIVNPYFRSRDQAEELAHLGINVVSTEPGLENSDIPALSPRIYALFQDQAYQRVIFDVGGDPVGARALGRFNPYFALAGYEYWMVINPFRPGTRSVQETTELIGKLQTASRLQITGLVGNINLGRETTPELWLEGLPLIETISDILEIPIVYQMVSSQFAPMLRPVIPVKYDVFEVDLRMRPSWMDM